MPHAEKFMHEEVINQASDLNQIVIIGNSIKEYMERLAI
jgi:hypothetical protein